MNITTLCTAPSWSADPAHCFDLWPSGLLPRDAAADLAGHIGQLDRLLARYQPTRALDRYLAGAPDLHERRDRWATLVLLSGVGLLPAQLPARPDWQSPGHTKRVLTDLEHAAMRAVALGCPIDVAAVALSEAGSSSHELHRIDTSWLTWPHPDTVIAELAGDTRHRPRQVELAEWSRPSLRQLTGERPAPMSLVYTGRSDDAEKRRSSVLMRLRKLVRRVGLHRDRSVSPESLRNTGARSVYDAAGPARALQNAADVLGLVDLDRVAGRIDLGQPAGSAPLIRWPR